MFSVACDWFYDNHRILVTGGDSKDCLFNEPILQMRTLQLRIGHNNFSGGAWSRS